MIHTALMRPSWMRSNISTAFGPCLLAIVGLRQKLFTAARPGVIVQVDVRGQRVHEAADLAATHGIRLAGHRERPGAWFADAAGGEMAVDDGVDLVGARGALVHALRERRDRRPAWRRTSRRSSAAATSASAAGPCAVSASEPPPARAACSASSQSQRVRVDEAAIDMAVFRQPHQQAVEQVHVGARRERQMQIGDLRGRGAARIERDDLHARPLLARRQHALQEDRDGTTPCWNRPAR